MSDVASERFFLTVRAHVYFVDLQTSSLESGTPHFSCHAGSMNSFLFLGVSETSNMLIYPTVSETPDIMIMPLPHFDSFTNILYTFYTACT